MNELVKDILEFYEVAPSAYVKCPTCRKGIEEKLERTPIKFPQSSLPWLLFFKDLYCLPILTCCEKQVYPTHIRLQPNSPKTINPIVDEMLFTEEHLYKIGTIKVPVITNDLQVYPITRTYEEQLVIQKQLAQQDRLLSRKQEEFYNLCYSYFSIHFEEIIQEIDGEEILDVLDAVMNTTFGVHLKDLKAPVKVNKKDKKAYLNWVKKQIRQIVERHDEQGKQIVFYLIVKYFVEWELIQGIYYLRWNIDKYQKMIGKTLLLYLVMQFPLTKHFSYLREDALHKLIPKKKTSQKKYEVFNIVQTDLAKTNGKIEKLQQTIERQRETILQLENKLESVESKNNQLIKELQAKEEQPNLITQTKKIKGLKGLIESLRYELHSLRDESDSNQKENLLDDSKNIDELKNRLSIKDQPSNIEAIDTSILEGKTIGIFGDIQIQQDQINDCECEVLNASSVQSIEGLGVMNKSEVLVVLTQHISHACMWALKEHAASKDLPILFTRHTNLKIILNQVASMLVSNRKQSNQSYNN